MISHPNLREAYVCSSDIASRASVKTTACTCSRIFTGMPFPRGKICDARIFCPPSGNVISWSIDNLTGDLTADRETSTHLPATDALRRAGIQLQTVNTAVRNLRLQRIYIESDR